MTNLKQRLERLEAAVKASAPEPARLYFRPGCSKETKIETLLLALKKEALAEDDPVTDEELRAMAVRLVESGQFDPLLGETSVGGRPSQGLRAFLQ